jgi:hypothetical protein
LFQGVKGVKSKIESNELFLLAEKGIDSDKFPLTFYYFYFFVIFVTTVRYCIFQLLSNLMLTDVEEYQASALIRL